MIKAMDELLQHWADRLKGRGYASILTSGTFGGVMPSSGLKGSRDLLGIGDMDDAAW